MKSMAKKNKFLPTPVEIRTARIESGLKQRECAALVGVTLRSWQQWEEGRRRISATAWDLWQIKTKAKKPG
jgi:DNA-binding transcriptional regulator YiaG